MEEQRKKRKIEKYYSNTSAEDVIFNRDMMENILGKFPFQDLARLRCVSKRWCYSLIPSILKTIESPSKLIVSSPGQVQIVDHEASNIVTKKCPFPLEEISDQQVLGSSNGFLCIGFQKNDKLALWNPLTNELYSNIICDTVTLSLVFHFITGFGYDNCSDDYKIVRILRFKLKVYSLKKNSWGNLGSIPFCSNMYIRKYDPNIGTLVNGALYWIFTTKVQYLIFRFQLADEKHSFVEPPYDIVDHNFELKLMVFEGNKLCAYQNHFGSGIEMWVLKEEELKWTKLMSIPHLEEVNLKQPILRFFKPLAFRRNGEVVLHNLNNPLGIGSLCLYNPKAKCFKWLDISGIEDWNYVHFTYEESIWPLRRHM